MDLFAFQNGNETIFDYCEKIYVNESSELVIREISFSELYDEIYKDTEYAERYIEFPDFMERLKAHNEKIQKYKSEMNYFEQLNVSVGHYGRNGQVVIAAVWSKPRCIASSD